MKRLTHRKINLPKVAKQAVTGGINLQGLTLEFTFKPLHHTVALENLFPVFYHKVFSNDNML